MKFKKSFISKYLLVRAPLAAAISVLFSAVASNEEKVSVVSKSVENAIMIIFLGLSIL